MGNRFKKHNIKIIKFFDERNLGSLPRTLISSLLVILLFYSFPVVKEFLTDENEFQNNSKAVLAYTLNQKDGVDKGGILNESDLLIDIFSLNDLETDTVRLNASTIKQLFEDTGYKLEDVRDCLLYTSPSPRD